jgi:hypothetical protein
MTSTMMTSGMRTILMPMNWERTIENQVMLDPTNSAVASMSETVP